MKKQKPCKGWRSSLQGGTFTWLLAGALSSSLANAWKSQFFFMGLSTGQPPECPQDNQMTFQVKGEIQGYLIRLVI